jgi:putative peptidoglycan lipid II flippase
MIMAAVTVVVNIVMSLLLFGPLGHVGIAIATTIAAWVNVMLLAIGLKGMVHVDRDFWVKILRMVMASVVMGVLVWLLYQGLATWFMGEFWLKCIVLGVLIVFGMLAYVVLALLMRVTSVAEMRAGFRRG